MKPTSHVFQSHRPLKVRTYTKLVGSKKRRITEVLDSDKAIARGIKNQLEIALKGHIAPEFHGIKGEIKGTREVANILIQVWEARVDRCMIAKFDLDNAFESVDLHRLAALMQRAGVPQKLIDAVGLNPRVQAFSPPTKFKGLPTGLPWSTLLLALFLTPMLKRLRKDYDLAVFVDDFFVPMRSPLSKQDFRKCFDRASSKNSSPAKRLEMSQKDHKAYRLYSPDEDLSCLGVVFSGETRDIVPVKSLVHFRAVLKRTLSLIDQDTKTECLSLKRFLLEAGISTTHLGSLRSSFSSETLSDGKAIADQIAKIRSDNSAEFDQKRRDKLIVGCTELIPAFPVFSYPVLNRPIYSESIMNRIWRCEAASRYLEDLHAKFIRLLSKERTCLGSRLSAFAASSEASAQERRPYKDREYPDLSGSDIFKDFIEIGNSDCQNPLNGAFTAIANELWARWIAFSPVPTLTGYIESLPKSQRHNIDRHIARQLHSNEITYINHPQRAEWQTKRCPIRASSQSFKGAMQHILRGLAHAAFIRCLGPPIVKLPALQIYYLGKLRAPLCWFSGCLLRNAINEAKTNPEVGWSNFMSRVDDEIYEHRGEYANEH